MNTWSKVAEEEKEIETEGKTREGGREEVWQNVLITVLLNMLHHLWKRISITIKQIAICLYCIFDFTCLCCVTGSVMACFGNMG